MTVGFSRRKAARLSDERQKQQINIRNKASWHILSGDIPQPVAIRAEHMTSLLENNWALILQREKFTNSTVRTFTKATWFTEVKL